MQQPYKYIPTSNVYINRRVDNLTPLGPGAFKQNFQFNGPSTGGTRPTNQFFNNRIQQNGQEVSETDLYLLSAIEKLVYRVDYMERRLRKTEQIVYYLMAGNNENKKEIYGKNWFCRLICNAFTGLGLFFYVLCNRNVYGRIETFSFVIVRKTLCHELHESRRQLLFVRGESTGKLENGQQYMSFIRCPFGRTRRSE